MFKIKTISLRADINAHHKDSWGPTIEMEVDQEFLPKSEDYRFKKLELNDGTMYVGRAGMFGAFFSYNKPGNGFGGRTYRITMEDGSTKDLIGPWSGRVGLINAEYVPSEHLVEVIINRSYYYISLEAAEELVKSYFPSLEIYPMTKFGDEVYYVISGDYDFERKIWPDDDSCNGDEQIPYKSDDYNVYTMRQNEYWGPESREAQYRLAQLNGEI